jgi:eukaryotic-like serine/threonine-protein kinase
VGNLDRARQQFEYATRLDAEFAAAYAGLAETYSRIFRGRREPNVVPLARTAAERAVVLNGRFANAHLALGAVLADSNLPDDAVRELETALKLDSLDPAAYLELARLQRAQRKFSEAEQTYLRAITARPDDWQSYSQLAVFYSSQQRDADAEKFFRKVTELAPDGPIGYRNLGATLFRLGRKTDAEVMIKKSLAIRPTVQALSNLGALMMFMGRYSEAVHAMEDTAKMAPAEAPNNYLVWGNLGDAYWLSKASPEKSRAAWTTAVQIAERQLSGTKVDAELLGLLAKYQAKLGHPAESHARATQALAYAPESAMVHYQAGLAHALLGEKEQGFAELKAAIERGYSINEIQVAPELASLRSDPRFEGIIRRDTGR